ncbi:SDR family oxidoreductase [Marinoscillum sp. MHG1-6]|uniref:SDR family oxidoreductase n=1 Tax=Marinoscillum sp. MHG1-6 TaxID=2959627 RepID=UPI0021575FA8|nr:SDR family oxidoreductase [Marinoscillum sp. MHG1-6]
MENNSKLIVVSGGTKGIGKAIIHSFSAKGFEIATCSRSQKDLDSLKSEVEAQYGNRVYVFKADLSSKQATEDFVEFVQMIGKPVEILVNNTGIFIPGEVHNEDEGALEKMIQTNLYSAYYLTRGLIHNMKENARGHIFNMCSTASIMAYSNGGSYCISKFALYGMSKVLREEMKPHGIRVTSVMPGATYTASWEGVDLPEERFMKPEDVAEMVLITYELSDRSVVEDLVIRPQLGDI